MKYSIISIVRLENHYRVAVQYIPNFIERVFLNKVPERIEVFGKGECWYKVSDYKSVYKRLAWQIEDAVKEWEKTQKYGFPF